ncbi:hypothetical protein ACVCAH_11345 [Micromonospora sp. LZ34]
MHDVSTATGHATPAVSPVDPWTRLKEALGVATQQEVADIAGVDLRTVQRMFERPEASRMGNALRLRAVSGIGLDELFPDADTLSQAA